MVTYIIVREGDVVNAWSTEKSVIKILNFDHANGPDERDELERIYKSIRDRKDINNCLIEVDK